MDQLVQRLAQTGLLVDSRLGPTSRARRRSDAWTPDRTSCTALYTVEELIPEASTTRACPPRPRPSPSPPPAPALHSFRCGNTLSKNPASPSDDSSTPQDYISRLILWWTLRRMARCRRSCATLASSHKTTVEAPISMRLSSPNPASATERASMAATARTKTPTTSHPSVAVSRRRPLRRNRRWSIWEGGPGTLPVCQAMPRRGGKNN